MEATATVLPSRVRGWAKTVLAGGGISPEGRAALRALGPYRILWASGAGRPLPADLEERLRAWAGPRTPVVRLHRGPQDARWLVGAGLPWEEWRRLNAETGVFFAGSPVHRSFRQLPLAAAQAGTAALGRLVGAATDPLSSPVELPLTCADWEEVEACLQRIQAVLRAGSPDELLSCIRGALAVLGRTPRGGRRLGALLGLLRARFVAPHQEALDRRVSLRRRARLLLQPEGAPDLEALSAGVAGFLTALGQELRSPGPGSVIDQAIEFTRNSDDAGLTMAVVANRFSMNYSRFSQRFKEAAGVGFNEYLRKVRIEKSIELLKQSPLRVYEVAHRAGYQSTKHFMKVFKEQTGLSPTEFRQAAG